MTVPPHGNFNVQGRVMDGTPFFCSGFLGPQGQIMLYQRLYTQPGSLLGECAIAEQAVGVRYVTSGPLSLYKPAQTSTAERLYRNGFLSDAINLYGGTYTPPTTGSIALGLPDQEENAYIYTSSSVQMFFRLRASGAGTLAPGDKNPQRFTFTLNPITGRVQRWFLSFDPDPVVEGRIVTRKATFFGLLMPPSLESAGMCIIPGLPDPTADPPTTAANVPWLTVPLSFGGN